MQIKEKNNWTVADMSKRIIFYKPVIFLFDNHDATKKQKHNAFLAFFHPQKNVSKTTTTNRLYGFKKN